MKNEKKHSFDFSVFSLYEEKAAEQAKKYKNSNFYFVKSPEAVNCFDKAIYWIAKNLIKKTKFNLQLIVVFFVDCM